MTTASAAFSALRIMGYVVGSIVVGYIAIRAYRHVKQRSDKPVALPRPVYETVPKKSPFAFVWANGRDWHMWQLPVPWTRSLAGSSLKSKAASVAFAKDLSVELLPTTALPPPPTSIPTSPPLVDLTSPSALEASASSRFSISLPSSPKRQSRPLWQQQPSSPKGHINIQHPAFPRPPSPHALLATTPPQRHTRSRSLGGVPVRRLSSGQSGLRNKVDVELHDLVPGHARGSSDEHLLIDFSSSSDDQLLDPRNDPAAVSAAASDIRVLPPSKRDNKVVEPRLMSLVDVRDNSNIVSTNHDSEPDNTAWMWFNFNAPSTIRSYDARRFDPRHQAAPFSGERKFAFPLPLPFQKTEKLIDILSNEDAGLELDSLDSSATLVEVESDLLGKKDQSPPIVLQETSADVISQTVDPFSDDYAVDYVPHVSQTRVGVHGNEDRVQNDPAFSDVGDNETQVRHDQSSAYTNPFVDVDAHVEPSDAAGLVFSETTSSQKAGRSSGWDPIEPGLPSTSTLSPVSDPACPSPSTVAGLPSQLEKTDWRWVETDDPWGDHVAVQDETFTLEHPYEDAEPVTRKHSAGSLVATLLDGAVPDDEVPPLDLDEPCSTEELRLSHVGRGRLDEDGEEDATPRPTPVSFLILLPDLEDAISPPAILVEDEAGNGQADEQAIINETYPDPGLLPLPEFSLPSSVVEVTQLSTNNPEDGSIKTEPPLPSQMPTPPASPPSLSPVLPNQRKMGKSLPSSPTGVARSRSGSSSPQTVQIAVPVVTPEEQHGDLVQNVSIHSPAAGAVKILSAGQAAGVVEETPKEAEVDEIETHKGTPTSQTCDTKDEPSLPGSLPEVSSTSTLTSSIASSKTTQTVAARLAAKPAPAPFHPSVRTIVRQPVEIALAMQLRPGLGAGADPAWMVRFLMAMFGWFAVLVSGQENY